MPTLIADRERVELSELLNLQDKYCGSYYHLVDLRWPTHPAHYWVRFQCRHLTLWCSSRMLKYRDDRRANSEHRVICSHCDSRVLVANFGGL